MRKEQILNSKAESHDDSPKQKWQRGEPPGLFAEFLLNIQKGSVGSNFDNLRVAR